MLKIPAKYNVGLYEFIYYSKGFDNKASSKYFYINKTTCNNRR